MTKLLGLTALVFLGLLGQSLCYAGELADAVGAVEKIQDITKVGVNNRDYGQALPEMMGAIKKYVRSSKKNPEVAKLIEKIGSQYMDAKSVWDRELYEIETMLLERENMGDTMEGINLEHKIRIKQIEISDKLSPIWAEASKDIKKALEVIEKKKIKW